MAKGKLQYKELLTYLENRVIGRGDELLAEKDIAGVVEEMLEAQNCSYKLGLKLGLEPHLLDSIHSEKDQFKCFLQVITEFIRQAPSPTWRLLVEALRSRLVNLPQLAKKVEANRCPTSTTPETEELPAEGSTLQKSKLLSRGEAAPTERLAPKAEQSLQAPEGKKRFGRQVALFKSEVLGTGTYSEVYKAKYNGFPCAAKVFNPVKFKVSHPNPSTFLCGLWEELSLARHQNLVRYFGPFHDPISPLPILLMEVCDECLNVFLARSKSPLPYHTQLNLASDVAAALVFLHSSEVVHGNLTGTNIFVLSNGAKAKLTDYGLSQVCTVNLCRESFNAHYLPPDVLNRAPSQMTQLDDVFSFGVVLIQILTKQLPSPTGHSELVYLPDYEETVTMAVPETKRRQSHLQLIQETHPLRPFCLQCLKKNKRECPSMEELSKRLSELKQSQLFKDSQSEADTCISRELQLVKKQLEEQNKLVETKSKEVEECRAECRRLVTDHERQLKEKEAAVLNMDQQLRDSRYATETHYLQLKAHEQTIEDQRKEIHETVQKLQQYLSIIVTRDKQIEEKDKVIQDKDEIIHANLQAMNEKESEMKSLQARLAEAKKHMEVLESRLEHMREKDELLAQRQEAIEARERTIQDLLKQQQQQQQRQDGQGTTQNRQPQPKQPIVRAMTSPPGMVTKHLSECMEGTPVWRSGGNAPEKMFRGAVVVHEYTAYFRPVNSHTVYAYQNMEGRESWCALPDNPNWNFGLAVIDGTLTSVGGSTKNLLSLISEGKRKQWQLIFPAMPTLRSKVACVTTPQALVVAGGNINDTPLATVEVMSIEHLLWSTCPQLPVPCSRLSAVVHQGTIYLAGGMMEHGTSPRVFSCSLPYLLSSLHAPSGTSRPAHHIWQEAATLPVSQSTLVSFGDNLLAVGGQDPFGHPTNDVHVYYPHSHLWIIFDQMKVHRRAMCFAATLQNSVVIVGGYTQLSQSGHPTDTVEMFQCT